MKGVLEPWLQKVTFNINNRERSKMMDCFSLSDTLLKDILHFAKPFGHREDARSLNPGFGFLSSLPAC